MQDDTSTARTGAPASAPLWTGAAPPAVPGGRRIYAIADIHGHLDLLERLLDLIAADAETAPPARPVLVFLGDYIDRGPQSRGVVDRLASGPPATGPLAEAEWITLRGNHEDYLLRFLDNTRVGPSWFCNGGMDTVRSYAGSAVHGNEADMAALQMALLWAIPPVHQRFLSRLDVAHREGDYLFVHAGIRPGIPLESQDPHDLMWIRGIFLASDAPFGAMVVHGHSITTTPDIRANRIGIDTGAFCNGRLTALVLEGTERRFLTAEL
jgi:serine/threonine protein phosphatase 1